MRLIEELKKIDEYFENMPQEVFEEKLIKAGFGKIKPGPLAMNEVITKEDLRIYEVGSNNSTMVINIKINEYKDENYKITFMHEDFTKYKEDISFNMDKLKNAV